MFMTSYRDEFGDTQEVANIITKDRLIEIRDDINRALAELSDENSNCNLQNVMPMLRQIAEYIDCGIEMANETKEWDEIHEIIEFIHGIAEDNHMFIRN